MAFGDVAKVLLLPATIALAIYLLITYVILPFYRNHYQRYAEYLPLETISSTSTTIWDRIRNAFSRVALPGHMRWRRGRNGSWDELAASRRGSGSGSEGEGAYFGEEEGESMVGFDVERVDRSVRGGVIGGNRGVDSQRRLSRDLEEGFKDDSDEEDARDDRRR